MFICQPLTMAAIAGSSASNEACAAAGAAIIAAATSADAADASKLSPGTIPIARMRRTIDQSLT